MSDRVHKRPFGVVQRAIVEQVARSIHELPEHVQALYYMRLTELKWTTDKARHVMKEAFG